MQQAATEGFFEGRLLVIATLLAALLLSVMPMPLWAQWLRPEWVTMVLLFWVITRPDQVGMLTAGLAGIALDILEAAPLGQNAFSLGVITYLALILYQRLRMFALLQQTGVVFVLIGIYQLLCHWIQTLTGTSSPNLMFLLPALVSAVLWPWLSLFLEFLYRRLILH